MRDPHPQRIVLSGNDWQLKGYIGEDWRWRDAHMPETRDAHNWIDATVPGSVHHDLWQAGQIENPYHGKNTLLAEWVSTRTWVYRRHFTVEGVEQGCRVQLCFEGVDYEASFYLNGQPLGSHASMFVPAKFEVGHLLNYEDDNLLAVVLQPAPHEQPQVGRSSLVRTHKTRMNYWWDFCPRLVHLGLWDDIYLTVTDAVRVDDVFVRPTLNEDYSEATLSLTVTLSCAGEQMITLELSGDGLPLHQSRHLLAPGTSEIDVRLTLQTPRLWWPNGYGEQCLYEAMVRVFLDPHGVLSDTRRVPFGVRHIAFLPNDGAPAGARPYTLAVNGRKMYINGWNWVPMDVLYGVERPQKRERLLRLAQEAHVNVLRVWGGGLIEKEAFYAACDRLGILVWQEFIQSSSGIENVPPVDEAHVRRMQGEALQIVPRRRNHPSLLLWCGGNELQDAAGHPQDDGHPLLGALKQAVQVQDPGRHWLPTSPSGPRFGNTLQNIAEAPEELHDVHGPWIYEGLEAQYTLFNEGTSLLNSEFGVEGITNLRTLNEVMPRSQQRPIRRANPLWHHLGAWWIWEEHWDEFWGGLVQWDTPRVVRATQFLQAEGLRYAVEANRRRKFHNSGSLPWQFNEPYPMAACTSAVDYYAQPKAAYHAVARAYAPLLLSAQFARIAWQDVDPFATAIWTSYASQSALDNVKIQARLISAGSEAGSHHTFAEWEWSVRVMPNASQEHALIQVDLASAVDGVFFLDLALVDHDGTRLARNRYPFSRGQTLAPFLNLPAPDLETSIEQDGNRWLVIVTNAGPCAAPGVWLEADRHGAGWAYFDDNFIHLLPAEQRAITVRWEGITPQERTLTLQALNGGTRVIHG